MIGPDDAEWAAEIERWERIMAEVASKPLNFDRYYALVDGGQHRQWLKQQREAGAPYVSSIWEDAQLRKILPLPAEKP